MVPRNSPMGSLRCVPRLIHVLVPGHHGGAVGDFLDVPWPKNGEIDIMDAFQGRGGSRVVPVRCLSLTLSQPCFDPPGNIFKSVLVGDMLVPRSVSHLCRLPYFSCGSLPRQPGMLKASVIHADETGEPSSAIFHGAARKVTAEACLDRRSVGTRHTLITALCSLCTMCTLLGTKHIPSLLSRCFSFFPFGGICYRSMEGS